MSKILWAVVSMALIGCASLQDMGKAFSGTANQKNQPGDLFKYRGELLITVDQVKFEGMAVTRLTGPLTVHIQSNFPLDRIQFTTCGRQDVVRDFKNDWFSKTKSYDYQYTPNKVELDGLCPLYIEAFNKSSLASWGYVAFRKDESFPARMDCNGVGWKFQGYSVCQTRAGLIQSISFEKPVVDFNGDAICKLKQIDKMNFDLRPGLGMCTAAFYDGSNWHLLNLLGYQRVLVQGE